jgi:4-carboxymuconolactone decarboxylase
MTTADDRMRRGMEMLERLTGEPPKSDDMPEYELVPGMSDWVTASLFGDVWGRPTLETKIRSIATMSALTVLGREPQVKFHVEYALNLGWTKEEIAELFFHLAFYGGLPAALNALGVAQQVFEERGLLK